MSDITFKGRKGYRIYAEIIRETEKAVLADCEGDVHWFPKSQIKIEPETNTLICSEWIYNEKFRNEQRSITLDNALAKKRNSGNDEQKQPVKLDPENAAPTNPIFDDVESSDPEDCPF